jgi:hypothetical protein
MKWNKHGLRLADVPGAGISRKDPNARSGNPRHDIRSGKFGGGGPSDKPRPVPANVDALAYVRMLDAARTAARRFDTVDEATVQTFIDERANAPEQVDIANFMAMVNEQRKADLVDIIDSAMRETEPGEKISLHAPPGLVASYMRALGADQVQEVMSRLEGMGHEQKEVQQFFDSRIKVVEEAKQKQKAVTASAQSRAEFPGMIVIPLPSEEEERSA